MDARLAIAICRESPNGVVVVDRECRIVFANPAFSQMFRCPAEHVEGRSVTETMGSDCFERALAQGGRMKLEETIERFALSIRGDFFPIDDAHGCCGGILVDVTEEQEREKHFRRLRAETLERAREVINRQMKTAQEIAGLLGEATAETKVLLYKLMAHFEEETEK
jgi:PAS domain-containing protein